MLEQKKESMKLIFQQSSCVKGAATARLAYYTQRGENIVATSDGQRILLLATYYPPRAQRAIEIVIKRRKRKRPLERAAAAPAVRSSGTYRRPPSSLFILIPLIQSSLYTKRNLLFAIFFCFVASFSSFFTCPRFFFYFSASLILCVS